MRQGQATNSQNVWREEAEQRSEVADLLDDLAEINKQLTRLNHTKHQQLERLASLTLSRREA